MTTGPSTSAEKTHLLTQAIALAERSSGTGGPPRDDVGPLLRAYYRHVATDDVGDRSAEELYGALVSHYRTAETRPQGTATRPRLHPDPGRARLVGRRPLGRRGRHRRHALPRRLGRHGAGPAAARRPPGHPPAVRRGPRRHRPAGLASTCPDNESAEPPEGAERESWMHVEISRIGHDEDVDAIALDVQRVLRDVRESVEDWDRMRQQAGVIIEELRADPPASIATEELERRRRLPRLARRRPLHVPRLPRVPPRARRRGDEPARRPRHRLRHPAQRPRPVVACGQLPAEGRRDGPRAHPAGAGEGQLPRDRAPPGVPRLRRREDVRRGRRGHRRAPLPRPVLQRGVHRVGLAHPAAAREGRRTSSTTSASTRTATPARP